MDESHEWSPSYNSIYTRALDSCSANLLHKDAVVIKVVAHLESHEKFLNGFQKLNFKA